MSDDQERHDQALVTQSTRGLITRSSDLARRGLDDLLKQQEPSRLARTYYDRAMAKLHISKDKLIEYRKAVENGPQSVAAFLRQAKEDLNGAIDNFDKAIEIDPEYASAYNSRGIARQRKGDHDGAIADYDRATQIDPRLVTAYHNRGISKQRKGDLPGAMIDFDKAIEIDPRYAKAFDSRGRAKQDKGDFEGAIADYYKAIEVNPRFTHPRVQRAFKAMLHSRLKREGLVH